MKLQHSVIILTRIAFDHAIFESKHNFAIQQQTVVKNRFTDVICDGKLYVMKRITFLKLYATRIEDSMCY